MDAGCYALNVVRYLIQNISDESARLLSGKEPVIDSAKAILLRPQVDHTMEVQLKFDDGCVGVAKASFRDPTCVLS
jgi:hypothetical protein